MLLVVASLRLEARTVLPVRRQRFALLNERVDLVVCVGHSHRLLRRIRRVAVLPGSNDVRPVDTALLLAGPDVPECRIR